jgi:hypothetical protein
MGRRWVWFARWHGAATPTSAAAKERISGCIGVFPKQRAARACRWPIAGAPMRIVADIRRYRTELVRYGAENLFTE